MENDGENTGVRHDDESIGVDRDNESMGIKSESRSTGATDKAEEMALIEEAIAEVERDITEGTEILAGTEAETEDIWDKNVIHPDLQVPTEEHTHNLRRRGNWQLEYTHRYGFQVTIIRYALKQLSKGQESGKCRTRTSSQEGCIFAREYREPFRKIEARVTTPDDFPKRKTRRINKGQRGSRREEQREKIKPKDATSPTVSTEAVMLTATINTIEVRDVAVVDIPGAYLSTDMNDDVHVVFRGMLADLVVASDPALYQPCVLYEAG